MSNGNRNAHYDVAVVGAGLDGLVAAALLARAGKSVVVLERREAVGGTVASEELPGGGRAAVAWPSAELFHPALVAELELRRHGLELLPARGGTLVPIADGPALHLPADDPAAALAAAGHQVDARAFRDFEAFLKRLATALEPALAKPLPELELRGAGDVLELLTLGFRLRRLGAAEMPEALRYLPMPVRDVLDERFRSAALKAAIAAPALRASWLAPRSAGSALTLLLARPAWTTGLLPRQVFVRGGLGRLSEAVAAAARAAGAEVRLGAAVAKIRHDAEGRANGVVLAGGDEVAARVVVSNADPKRTLLELAEPSWLEPAQAFAAGNVRTRGTVALVRFRVGALPRFAGAPATDDVLAGRVQLGASLDELERAFDPVKYGELPSRPLVELTVPTLADAELAPAGRHVVEAWVQWVPYRLAEGDWESRREELGDLVTARIDEQAPGFAAAVEARSVTTPRDLEARFGPSGGCLLHAEPALDQLLFMRPMAGWYRHRTPVEGLYLCGPGTHPGIATSGLQGRNAARRILADLA